MINRADSRMKPCGQNVAPNMWNLLSARSHSTAWRPPQFSHTVPKNARNRKPAPATRKVRYRPVKLRVWIWLSLDLAVTFFGCAGSWISTVRTGIISLMVVCSSASIRPVNYARRAVCITDSGVAIKSGSDALQRPCCDNVLHPVAPGAQLDSACADTDQSNHRITVAGLQVFAPILGAGDGQRVGLDLGDVDPVVVQRHKRHGFFAVGTDGDLGRGQALFLAVVIDREVADLVFDTYRHGELLVIVW